MFNLKLTIYGALFGLIVSIFFGLVGGIQFGVILLRALISALLCGGILALTSFLFKRFLSESKNDFSSDNASPVTGGLVDITVDEDVLPDSDNAPDFYVSKKYTNNSSVQDVEQRTSDENLDSIENKIESTSFVPNKDKTEFSSEEVSTPNAQDSQKESQQFVQTSLVKEKYTSSETSDSGLESLDSLPEMGSIVPDARPQESDVIEDSAFAKGESLSSDLVPDAAVGADTNLMAEAIKTLLRREG